MELRDALRTTGAVREFTEQPVTDGELRTIFDTARFAPSGGNRQAWRAIVVRDPDTRRALRDLYLPGWYEYLAMRAAGLVPWAPVTDRAAEAEARATAADAPPRTAGDSGGMAEHLDRVPALLVIVADLRGLAAVDRDLDRYTLVGGASVYPFVWSVLLAAREAGLAGVLTTMLVPREEEVRHLLEIPGEYAVAAAIALGHPLHQPTRLSRRAVDDFVTVDRFDGRALGSAS